MRRALFVLEPRGTGNVWRCLAIAEQLKRLFPAIEPRFLAGPAAAALLREQSRFEVEETLAPIVPARGTPDGELARASERAARRLAPGHAREARRAARACAAELVVVDGLFAAPPVLARAGFDVAFLAEHLLDEPVAGGVLRRAAAHLLRRSVVASTKLRFVVGEPGYLASPELRVWSRRWFRYTGPISGLARLDVRACATLRDDLGLSRATIVVIAAGSAFSASRLEAALEAAERVGSQAVTERRGRLVVKAFASPELSIDDPRVAPFAELDRWLAIADAAVIPAELSLLSEAAGLRVPALALPLPSDPLEQRHADWFAGRFGVRALDPTKASDPAAIATSLAELLASPAAFRPRDAPDADEQRRNADFVADLLAEQLGRRRPTAPG